MAFGQIGKERFSTSGSRADRDEKKKSDLSNRWQCVWGAFTVIDRHRMVLVLAEKATHHTIRPSQFSTAIFADQDFFC
jgi:hypothetical protein